MSRSLRLFASVWLAGYVAGCATLYCAGPAIGARLQASGARLAGMEPTDATILVDASAQAAIDELVTARVMALAGPGRRPMPATWGKR